MCKNSNLVASIDAIPHNAEKPENLKIFLLVEHERVLLVDHAISQFTHQMISNAIFDQEIIILEKLLKKIEVAWLVHHHHVLDDKINPFGDVYLEEKVISD